MTRALFFSVLAFAASCGGRPPVVATPLTDAQRRVFDDGLDLVSDPDLLEGQWRESWVEEIQTRLGSADYVAIALVQTLRTDVDLDQKQTFRLVVHAQRDLWNYPPSEEFTLSVREGDPGYNSIAQNQTRLFGTPYVLALKWEHTTRGDGTLSDVPVARWHLSPASEAVVRRVEFLLARRRDTAANRRVRVIERTN